MRVLAVDPGTTKSGWCVLEGGVPVSWGWDDNGTVLGLVLTFEAGPVVIEDVGHYGLPVGRDVFETVKWMGRFDCGLKCHFIPRHDVLINLCGKRKGANDSTVRQALIDRYGGDAVAIGGKKCRTCSGKGWRGRNHDECVDCKGKGLITPRGPLHGLSGHVWSALACGLTYLDQVNASNESDN